MLSLAIHWRYCYNMLHPGGHLLAFASTKNYHRMAVAIEDAGFEIRDQIGWLYGTGFPKSHKVSDDGWRTALKPAWEPICLARKPIEEETIRRNMEVYRVGGLNIEGCRTNEGRFPANVIHDGSSEVLDAFPYNKDGIAVDRNRDGEVHNEIYGARKSIAQPDVYYGGSGSAARFFFSAKASKKDRVEGSTHPTVKPVSLMRYLTRLVTPVGGTVLDPFAGTGTTLQAAYEEGFNSIGIEREVEYAKDIAKRMSTVCERGVLDV